MSLKLNVTILLLCVSTILFLVSLYFLFRSPKPSNLNVIRAHKGWASIAIFVGVFLAYGGVWSIYYGTNGHPPNSLSEAACVSAMGFAFVGLILPSLTKWHEVIWDEDSVEGPNELFGPTVWFSRTKINWSDVALRGQTFTLYHYVETHNGDRVYYSPYSTGLDDFEIQLSHIFA